MTLSGGQKRKYKRPPIVEVVAEFRLAPSGEWDPTLPGKFQQHESIVQVYTGKPRAQRLRNFLLHAVSGAAPEIATQDFPERVQLPDALGHKVVTLGPNTLSVSCLAPYDGWDEYKPRIQAAAKAYEKVAGEMRVVGLGLRYINVVTVPAEANGKADLEEYFHCAPPIIEGLPRDHHGYSFNCEYVYEDGVKLQLNHALLEITVSAFKLVLDLDLGWASEVPVASETALSLLDLLHDRESTAFEAIITDKTRGTFDAD